MQDVGVFENQVESLIALFELTVSKPEVSPILAWPT